MKKIISSSIISSSLLCMAFATQAADLGNSPLKPLSLDPQHQNKQTHWITIGQDAVNDLHAVGAKEFLMPSTVAAPNSKSVSVAQITEGQLGQLSRLMHDNHHRLQRAAHLDGGEFRGLLQARVEVANL